MNKDQNTLPGPVFEAGPGWGQRLGRWIKNNWTTKLFPTVAVVVLLAGIAKVYSQPKNNPSIKEEHASTPQAQEEVTVTVQRGGGIVTVSRHALVEYLKDFPEINLKPEEKLHVENFFQVKLRRTSYAAGQEVKFLKSDLRQAVDEATKLSESQRQKLRAYLK